MQTPLCRVADVLQPGTIVVDCRFDLANAAAGEQAFREGHIPGAIYWHLDQHLCGEMTGLNGRHPMPDRQAWQRFLQEQGIEPDSRVVVYDASGGCYAARAWWMLRWAGVTQSLLLDGGWQSWLAINGSVDVECSPLPSLRGKTITWPLKSALELMTVSELSGCLPSIQLVDARAPARFAGEVEPLDPVAGHIPGAVNRFYQDNLQEPTGRFKAPEDLRDAWDQLVQRTGNLPLVMQCGSGVTACHHVVAMLHAGLPAPALYAGSWSEWCADTQRPVAKGHV